MNWSQARSDLTEASAQELRLRRRNLKFTILLMSSSFFLECGYVAGRYVASPPTTERYECICPDVCAHP